MNLARAIRLRIRMSTDDDPLESWFDACFARYEAEGAAGVEAFCREHPADSDEIRARFAALHEMGMLEERSATTADKRVPEKLGEFLLGPCLGGGGMGVVYLAEQERLQRRVAIKLIRPDQLLFPMARERFQREVEAVARLQHPGIVSVYTVGEDRGVPYFVMEWVRGASLAQVVLALRDRGPAGLTGRDLRAVVDRFAATSDGRGARRGASSARGDGAAGLFDGTWIGACLVIVRRLAGALQHAHENGVLHRDIKPSNAMVTPDGRVLLLDFGLARADGSATLTRSGTQVGSLAYMSPEQTRGDGVGPESDVYSLAVTLYELLTLHVPYEGETAEEIRSRVLAGRPAAMRAHNPAVTRDVETVCLTAMDVDRHRRYASAAAFAEDLTNLLERRPIRARRRGPWLRARRWMQRHPAVTVCVAVLVLAGGSLVSTQRSAERAVGEAERRADAAFERATRSLEDSTAGIAGLAGVAGSEALRRDHLTRAVEAFEEFLRERPHRPERRMQVALARRRLAAIHRELGDHSAARLEYVRAIDLAEELLRDEPSSLDRMLGAIDAYQGLSSIAIDPSERRSVHERALDLCRAGASIDPDRIELRHMTAATLLDLAAARQSDGADAEAETLLREALDLETTLLDVTPDAPEVLRGVLIIGHNLAKSIRKDAARIDEAVALERRAIDAGSRLIEIVPGNVEFQALRAASRSSLATMLALDERELEAAAAAAREAVDELARLVESSPLNHASRKLLGGALGAYAGILARSQPREEFAPVFERAIAVDEAILAEHDDPAVVLDLAHVRLNLGTHLLKRGHHRDALDAYERAAPSIARALAAAPGGVRERHLESLRYQYTARAFLALDDPAAAAEAAEALAAAFDDEVNAAAAATIFEQCVAALDGWPDVPSELEAAAHAWRARAASLRRRVSAP